MSSFPGGTVSGNILPTVTGQDLGSPAQRWDAFLQAIDAQASNHTIEGDVAIDGSLSVTGSVSAASLNGILYANANETIQQTFDKLPSSGGFLYVPAGTYGLLHITISNVTIFGAPGSILTSTVQDDNVITIDGGLQNVTLDGLTVVAGGKTIDEPNANLGNCVYVSGAPGSTCSNIIIRNCFFSGGHNGVYFSYVNNGAIRANTFNFAHAALSQIELDGSNNNVVLENLFVDSGGTANAVYILTRLEHGSPSDPSDGNLISNNSVSGTYAFEAFNCFKSSNIFSANSILLTDATSSSSGIVIQCVPLNVDVHSNIITANVIDIQGTGGTGNAGIQITHNTEPEQPFDNIISNNIIRLDLSGATGSYGIHIGKTLGSIVESNRIIGLSGLVYGINVSDIASADAVISQNLIESTDSQGIRFVGTNISVTNNTITYAGSEGIFLDSGATGSNSTIAFNNIGSSTGRGISISDNAATNIGYYGNNEYNNGLPDSVGATNLYRSLLVYTAANVTGSSTSIGSTNLITSAPAGLYRLDYVVEVMTPATTSSAIQVNFSWNNGNAQSISGTNETGNTTATFDQGSFIVRSAAAQSLAYSTTYTSSGATAMLYDLSIRVEEL